MWEGVWPYLDPMDGVCLRTASMEWNVPGKYGPHGELFFFLIQKEPTTMLGSHEALTLCAFPATCEKQRSNLKNRTSMVVVVPRVRCQCLSL